MSNFKRERKSTKMSHRIMFALFTIIVGVTNAASRLTTPEPAADRLVTPEPASDRLRTPLPTTQDNGLTETATGTFLYSGSEDSPSPKGSVYEAMNPSKVLVTQPSATGIYKHGLTPILKTQSLVTEDSDRNLLDWALAVHRRDIIRMQMSRNPDQDKPLRFTFGGEMHGQECSETYTVLKFHVYAGRKMLDITATSDRGSKGGGYAYSFQFEEGKGHLGGLSVRQHYPFQPGKPHPEPDRLSWFQAPSTKDGSTGYKVMLSDPSHSVHRITHAVHTMPYAQATTWGFEGETENDKKVLGR